MFQKTTEKGLNFKTVEKLYLSNERLNPGAVFRRIRHGKRLRSLYLIVLSERDGELFVIYPAKELLLPMYEGRQFEVAGIGRGRRKTLLLLEQMFSDMIQEMNTIDVDHYFHS
ncbi:MAG: hypothetical protein IJ679_01820 [Lachnospiraceae bacterium]|nr:hypothetical protein [Lachnospiraceae bacterium]